MTKKSLYVSRPIRIKYNDTAITKGEGAVAALFRNLIAQIEELAVQFLLPAQGIINNDRQMIRTGVRPDLSVPENKMIRMQDVIKRNA